MSRRSRSRSRSPRKERDDRKRKDDRDRKREKKERKRRHRSSSSSSAEPHQLGSILKEERRRRELSRDRNLSPRIPFPGEVPSETSVPFDVNSLNEAAKKWLEDRITEQVTSKVDKLEAVMAEKATSARNEMEKMLRSQIEAEMSNELEECKRRDEESRKRCKHLESELERKIAEAEESRQKYEENRLAMLEQKGQLERERADLAREKAELKRNEQQTILNKSGNARAPIKFKFGK